jgi:oxygen-independent coproporphyrinogen-3 oxidase
MEAGRFANALGSGTVRQIHLGGGSPTFLRPDQLERLYEILDRSFSIHPAAERAVEIDPRITTAEQFQTLRDLGFNRISLGVQDFDLRVQRAVNRLQSLDMVRDAVELCRRLGFESINFDLIYGLPFQTLETMEETLEKTIALSPDRIAFYRLAVIPEMFRWQKAFASADLPGKDLTLDLNLLAINRLLDAGYEFIGLDHFARPGEALAQARKEGSLCRTFQGMSTGKGLNILGLGPSAITQLDTAFAQNAKNTQAWNQTILDDFATENGIRLSADDRLRRELLQQLYCYGAIDKQSLEQAFDIRFDTYFLEERERIEALFDLGLVEETADSIEATHPLGRLLVRVVAAVFDRYLPATAFQEGAGSYSKVG